MKFHLCFLIFLLLVTNVFAQYSDTTFIVKDYNTDGYKDTLAHFSVYGSGFADDIYFFINGKSKKRLEQHFGHSYADFLRIYPFEKLWYEKEYESVRLEIEQLINKSNKEPESSLKWLLRFYENLNQVKEGQTLKKIYAIPLKWERGKPLFFKAPYSTKISLTKAKALNKFLKQTSDNTIAQIAKNQDIILTYFAHCHTLSRGSNIQLRGQNKLSYTSENLKAKYKIGYSDHGIYWEKDQQHAWLFINDYTWTRGVSKLRWASINQIIVHNEVLLVTTNGGPDGAFGLYIISLKTGNIGQVQLANSPIDMRFDSSLDTITYKFEDYEGSVSKTENLAKLIQELE